MPRDPSNPNGLRFETAEGVDHVVFTVPILSEQVLSSLASTLRSIAARADPRPLVLRSDHPTVFLAGADLREIAVLDSASCVDYADLGRSVVTALESHPAPTVAATAGSCSGGGFDIALACDAIVAGPRASFDHPGVRRGLVTGWTGTVSAPAGHRTHRRAGHPSRRPPARFRGRVVTRSSRSDLRRSGSGGRRKGARTRPPRPLQTALLSVPRGEVDSLTDSAPSWYINYDNVATCLFQHRLKTSQKHGCTMTLWSGHCQRGDE